MPPAYRVHNHCERMPPPEDVAVPWSHNGNGDEDAGLRADALARRVALASIVISAILAVVKITVGLKANSTAVVSDGMESAADVLASGLVLFDLILAAKPPG